MCVKRWHVQTWIFSWAPFLRLKESNFSTGFIKLKLNLKPLQVRKDLEIFQCFGSSVFGPACLSFVVFFFSFSSSSLPFAELKLLAPLVLFPARCCYIVLEFFFCGSHEKFKWFANRPTQQRFFYPPPVNSFVVLNMHCLTFLLWAIAFEILMRQPDLHGLPLPVKPKLSFARSELWNFHGMFISYFCFPPPSAAEPELLIDFCFPWSFLHIG